MAYSTLQTVGIHGLRYPIIRLVYKWFVEGKLLIFGGMQGGHYPIIPLSKKGKLTTNDCGVF